MMRPHTKAYHKYTKQELDSIQTKLTEWYNKNRRKLPWRGDKPPYGNDSLSINENMNNLNIEPPTKKRKLSNLKQSGQSPVG